MASSSTFIIAPPPLPSSSSTLLLHYNPTTTTTTTIFSNPSSFPRLLHLQHSRLPPSFSFGNNTSRAAAAEYKFPDPIPEFATAETEKFTAHLLQRLAKKKDLYGDSLQEVLQICTQIFNTFMHTEYGGPGTLMVVPFIDMSDTINERGLPGGPQAARAAVKWAQDHVDKDWNLWTGDDDST